MKAELIKICGSDKDVADVARVSYGEEADSYSEEANNRLIRFLIREGHTSPFRHTLLQFRLEMPIYVERQMFKHQIGVSANSISGRYVDFSDTYHEIKQFRTQSKSSKQGSGADLSKENNDLALRIQYGLIKEAEQAYEALIDLGVSKEQARTVLPLNLNTKCIMTFSFLAFIHLCKLRLKPDAQKETRDIVDEMLKLLKQEPNFKESLKTFGF